ncbi:hypothetical protein [Candidatus Protofrankia californiensis]|uniref:hypothetical protein n=1 Tax=Candidatus Protofrankia californiensis TaxID=1839754 RepID=UPI001041A3A6|nr:hypothetical protein [Candidatus Protofrankia californiensis]
MTRSRRTHSDTGSFSLEFAVGFAVIVLAILLVAVAYQVRATSAAVTAAARQAARAASLTASPDQARAAASQRVRDRLASGPCQTGTVDVTTDTADFHAGGIVAVTVACQTQRLLGPSRRIVGHADEVIDRYRGGLP